MPTYIFTNDETQLREAIAQSRKIGHGKYLRGSLKLACLVGLSILLAFSSYIRLWSLATLFGFFIFMLWVGPHIDYWIARRKLTSSVYYKSKTTLEVDSFTLRASFLNGKSEFDWSSLSKVVRCPYGFMVYFDAGPGHWWPDSALIEGSVEDVAFILKQHAKTYRGA